MRFVSRAVRFWTALLMLGYWTVLHTAPAAAALAPSRVSGETAIASLRDADLVIMQRALEHKLVIQKLRDYGVSPAEVQARLATMSDDDIHVIAATAKGLPSGGDGAGTLVTFLIIVLLVILIFKLLNKDIIIK